MLIIKEGVKGYCKTGCVRENIWHAIEVAKIIYAEHNKNCIITSLCDGKHSKNSKHYEGNAVDLRTRHLSDIEKADILTSLKLRLSNEYDIILEATHIHIEYDPKEV